MCEAMESAQGDLAAAVGEIAFGVLGIARAGSPAARLYRPAAAGDTVLALRHLGWAAAVLDAPAASHDT